MPLLSVAAQHILNITHTVGVCCGAILSADRIVAAVTPTVCKMTYTVSSRTFNDTQTNKQSGLVADTVAMFGIEFIIVFTANNLVWLQILWPCLALSSSLYLLHYC